VRELEVFAEIYPFHISLEELKNLAPKGVILSGGPSSVYDEKAPHLSFELSQIGVPILGICYGLQLIA
jgi:GMP synthase (glutamine-hydrolysing)